MRTHDKHVLMCVGPRCTAGGCEADTLFQVLGQAIDARHDLRVKRTRTHCFAVCRNGPLMVVYPEGVWYQQLNAEHIEKIVEEHLVNHRPVDALVFHRIGMGDTAKEEQA